MSDSRLDRTVGAVTFGQMTIRLVTFRIWRVAFELTELHFQSFKRPMIEKYCCEYHTASVEPGLHVKSYCM